MEDIDGGLHPAVDGQSLDDDDGQGHPAGMHSRVGNGSLLGPVWVGVLVRLLKTNLGEVWFDLIWVDVI